MADFNPETGVNLQPNSSLGYAGNPAPADKSFATLFGGASDLINNAAGVVDTQNLFDIKDQMQNTRDAVDKQFGYDTGSVPAQVGTPTNTPPELASAAANMNKLQAAKAQGKLTDSHYWALMQSQVKDLKSKYAGYSDQIDQIAQQVTGGVPANQLRAAVDAYNQRLAGAAEDTTKQMTNYINSSPYLSKVAPDYYPGNPKYSDPSTLGQVYTRLHQMETDDQSYKSHNLALESADKDRQDVKQQATNLYSNKVQQEVYSSLNSVGTAMGVSGPGNNFFNQVKQLGDNPNPQAVNTVLNALNNARNDLRQKFGQMHMDNVGNKLTSQEQDQIETAALKQLDDLKDTITSGQFGIAGRWQRDNDQKVAYGLNTLLNTNHGAYALATLTKLNPAIAANAALDHGNDMVNMYQSDVFNPVQAGVMTPDKATALIQSEPKTSPQIKSMISTANVKGLVSSLINPQTPTQLVKQQAGVMFDPTGNGGMEQTWRATADNSKGALLNTILTPSLVDRVAAADPQAAQNLAGWAFNKAQSVPEIRAMAGNISQANTPYTAGYVYNPNTHQFLAAPPKGSGDFSPDVIQNQVNAAQTKVAGFNKTLAALAYTMTKAGIDPNDPNSPKAIPAFLRSLGATGQSGDIPALQKAMQEHLDETSGDTPREEANLSDAGPSFEFLSDPATAQGYKEGSIDNGDIKSVLRQAEAGKSGYDASIGDNGTPVAAFSKMTMSQVLQAQAGLPNSKAVGAYQFIPSTLHYAMDKAGVKLSDKFDEATQDKLADVLMEDAGYSRWKAGKLSDNDFQNNLASIWAGLPETSGMSHYQGFNGNKSTVSVGQVQSALKRSRA